KPSGPGGGISVPCTNIVLRVRRSESLPSVGMSVRKRRRFMGRTNGKAILLFVVMLAVMCGADMTAAAFDQGGKHTLTPADDVGLTLLYQYGSGAVPSGG